MKSIIIYAMGRVDNLQIKKDNKVLDFDCLPSKGKYFKFTYSFEISESGIYEISYDGKDQNNKKIKIKDEIFLCANDVLVDKNKE